MTYSRTPLWSLIREVLFVWQRRWLGSRGIEENLCSPFVSTLSLNSREGKFRGKFSRPRNNENRWDPCLIHRLAVENLTPAFKTPVCRGQNKEFEVYKRRSYNATGGGGNKIASDYLRPADSSSASFDAPGLE